MPGRLKTVTLGCKVNQYETQLVAEGLRSAGFVDALPGEPADFCVVNTCTVTAGGDSQSRQVIRKLHRENPDARIVVMGCYASRAPGEVAALPGVAEVVRDRREIPDLLGRHGVIDTPTGIHGLDGRVRAFVKVQDGCLLRCSYCIIPAVRPGMSSRPVADVVAEVRRLVDGGCHEVVLTGIHLGHYGVDFNMGRPRAEWTRLHSLVASLLDIPGDFRIRLSSIEATEVTRSLLAVMAGGGERVCPHLHVCLQSGSDRILRQMKRRWSVRQIIDRCREIRDRLDQPALTTDVIVGFPGETEADLQATLDVCRDIGFAKIHIFPFSARRGTPAADLPDQLPRERIRERCSRLDDLAGTLRDRYFAELRGRPVRLLVENRRNDSDRWGTICRFAQCDVEGVPWDQALTGRFLEVRVAGSRNDRLIARPAGQLASS